MGLALPQKGFTLIELMVAIAIIAIISAIAIPSYRVYVRNNAEKQAQASLLGLGVELEQWRAQALTYGGFTPRQGWSSTADTVYIPYGSTATNSNYAIQIMSVSSASSPVATSLSTASPANSWVMVATPRSGSIVQDMPSVALTSQGVRCSSTDSSIMVSAATNQNCGAGSTAW